METNHLPKKNLVFNLIYYSHVHLVIMAMVLSAVVNLVLTQQVAWPAVIFIGMATFMTYSIDNLVDWPRDRVRYLEEEKLILAYHKVSVVLIFLCILGAIWFMATSNSVSIIGLALLAGAVLFSILRIPPGTGRVSQKVQSLTGFLLNRVFISLVWGIICVFVPLWYAGFPVNLQAWTTAIYLWMLLFIYAVIWKQEKSSLFLQQTLDETSIRIYLQALSISAALVPVTNILVGRIPVRNLVNTLPPLLFFFLLEKYHLDWKKARQKLIWIALMMAAAILVVFIIHLLFD